VKAYAAMGLLHAAIDAAMQLHAAGGVAADEIARIDIYLPGAAYGHGGWQPERRLAPPIGAQMNVMYTVAVALPDVAYSSINSPRTASTGTRCGT
jgi:aconitate decarboxylase